MQLFDKWKSNEKYNLHLALFRWSRMKEIKCDEKKLSCAPNINAVNVLKMGKQFNGFNVLALVAWSRDSTHTQNVVKFNSQTRPINFTCAQHTLDWKSAFFFLLFSVANNPSQLHDNVMLRFVSSKHLIHSLAFAFWLSMRLLLQPRQQLTTIKKKKKKKHECFWNENTLSELRSWVTKLYLLCAAKMATENLKSRVEILGFDRRRWQFGLF